MDSPRLTRSLSGTPALVAALTTFLGLGPTGCSSPPTTPPADVPSSTDAATGDAGPSDSGAGDSSAAPDAAPFRCPDHTHEVAPGVCDATLRFTESTALPLARDHHGTALVALPSFDPVLQSRRKVGEVGNRLRQIGGWGRITGGRLP